jgi:hypothetical protein
MIADKLASSTMEFLQAEKAPGEDTARAEYAAAQVKEIVENLALHELNLQGEVHLFGSFSNGFRTGSSDVDVVFVGDLNGETPQVILNNFATHAMRSGFTHITKIFQANVPLVKLTHAETGIEVDLCVNNRLGVRNSYLLLSYCCYDSRIADLGRLVKAFAKSRDLVGTADGLLNSYAYMLLVIHYILHVKLAPNLQTTATQSVFIDRWDVKFCEDLTTLPESSSPMQLPELLLGFFHYYAYEFDWTRHAVCMRLYEGNEPVDKFSLHTPIHEDQWYVEDPFDLKHNLGGKCSPAGKKHILDAFKDGAGILRASGNYRDALGKPPAGEPEYILRCRINNQVLVEDLFEFFSGDNIRKLYYPTFDKPRFTHAFLIFGNAEDRRAAQAHNDEYIKGDCMLALHVSTRYGREDAIRTGSGYTPHNPPWPLPPISSFNANAAPFQFGGPPPGQEMAWAAGQEQMGWGQGGQFQPMPQQMQQMPGMEGFHMPPNPAMFPGMRPPGPGWPPQFDQFGNPQPFMPGQMPYPMAPGGKGMWGQNAGGPPPPPPPPQPKAKAMNRKMEMEHAAYPFGNQMMFPGGPQMQVPPMQHPLPKAGEVRLTPAQAKAKAKAEAKAKAAEAKAKASQEKKLNEAKAAEAKRQAAAAKQAAAKAMATRPGGPPQDVYLNLLGEKSKVLDVKINPVREPGQDSFMDITGDSRPKSAATSQAVADKMAKVSSKLKQSPMVTITPSVFVNKAGSKVSVEAATGFSKQRISRLIEFLSNPTIVNNANNGGGAPTEVPVEA